MLELLGQISDVELILLQSYPALNDRTGLPEISHYEITALGRLLLRNVDVLPDGEY